MKDKEELVVTEQRQPADLDPVKPLEVAHSKEKLDTDLSMRFKDNENGKRDELDDNNILDDFQEFNHEDIAEARKSVLPE